MKNQDDLLCELKVGMKFRYVGQIEPSKSKYWGVWEICSIEPTVIWFRSTNSDNCECLPIEMLPEFANFWTFA